MGKITLLNGTMKYSKELHDDEYQLEKHFATSSATLTQNIVYMAAAQSNQFPLTAITEGGISGVKAQYVDELEYDYPVSDNISTIANVIAKNNYLGDTTSKPGIGGSPFEMFFEQPLIPTYEYILRGNVKVHCKDSEEVNGMYKGTFTLVDSTDGSKYVPLSCFEVGAKAARTVSLNSAAGSRGNGSLFVTPYKKKNMLNVFRKTYKWEGELPTKVVRFNYKKNEGDKGKTLWMDYRKWQFMKEWQMEKEIGIWEGEYNKTDDGRITLVDKRSGNPAPRGAGVWEQIPNWDSYSVLTANKIKTVMRDVFRQNGDTTGKDIKVFGGTIAAENFDNAMKALLGENRFQGIGDKFVTGSGSNLEFGGYFTKYRTIDGNSFTFVKSRMFDDGPRAIVADDYKDGYTTESGKMVFIDDSTYDGESNIRMVIKKGMENYMAKVAGVGTQEGGSQPEWVASDYHGSSHEYMTMRNIQIMRNSNCFVLEMEVN